MPKWKQTFLDRSRNLQNTEFGSSSEAEIVVTFTLGLATDAVNNVVPMYEGIFNGLSTLRTWSVVCTSAGRVDPQPHGFAFKDRKHHTDLRNTPWLYATWWWVMDTCTNKIYGNPTAFAIERVVKKSKTEAAAHFMYLFSEYGRLVVPHMKEVVQYF